MRLRFHLLVPAVGLLLFGCDHAPTQPVTGPYEFTFTASSSTGDPSHPVTLTAHLTNTGRGPLTYLAACGATTARIGVLAPDKGNVVDACSECPIMCLRCNEVPVTLEPGQSVSADFVFTGTLNHCDGSYQGPAGVYTAQGAFLIQTPVGTTSVTRTTTFTWATTQAP